MTVSDRCPAHSLSTACRVLRVVVAIAGISRAAGILFEELPSSEREARIRLEEGTLDSTIWEVVREYYDEPVSVPLGELAYLDEALTWGGQDLPVTSARLSRYEPWGPGDIDRFFDDYPGLLRLRPILSFDWRTVPHVGIARFATGTRGSAAVPRQSARFSFSPADPFRLDGSFDFEADHARWDRRRIRIRVPGLGDIQLGNFDHKPGRGMFLGYFPASDETSDHTRENWLFGDARAYNGAAVHTRVGDRAALASFAHHRPTETAAGVELEISPFRHARFLAGVSGLDAETEQGPRDSAGIGYAGADVFVGEWEAGVYTGAASGAPGTLPVVVRIGHRRKNTRLDGSYFRIPRAFRAPRSRMLHDVKSKLDLRDSIAESVSGLDVAYSETFTPFLTHSYGVLYLIGESGSALETSCGLSGREPVTYVLRYYYRPSLDSAKTSHRLYGRIGRRLNGTVALDFSARFYARRGGYRRVKVSGEPSFDWVPAVTFSPLVSYSVNSRGEDDVVAGFCQRLRLFEKTFGEVRCTAPVLTFEDEGIHVYAKTGFFF
ncbi:MAG: hypothetical protein GF418_12080 [Chitinivibrionales bacterium]|nr:hypothetical protein [Chitinivibrionales bacterium]MBD3396356.1 hypothetical protein [Chitinivibrionales bacterium]